MRAVIYCRVSTKEQVENLSLGTQQKACTEYCQRHGIEIDQVFREEGESAKTADRTELKRLLEYCRINRKLIDFVVIYSVSRFSRNVEDYVTLKAMLTKLGIRLRYATEQIDESSSGKFQEHIMAVCRTGQQPPSR